MDKTLDNFKQFNKDQGMHFFSADTMRFFRSRICSDIIRDVFFITSEACGFRGTEDGKRREYNVRAANWKTGSVESVKRGFKTKAAAEKYIKACRHYKLSHQSEEHITPTKYALDKDEALEYFTKNYDFLLRHHNGQVLEINIED